MDTRTLVTDYAKKEKVTKVLNTNYVILSSRIKKTKERVGIVNATNKMGFLKIAMRLSNRDKDIEGPLNQSLFKEFFNNPKNFQSRIFLEDLIIESIINDEDIVFLSSPNEMQMGYYKELSKFVYDNFKYPIIDYRHKKKDLKKMPFIPIESLEIILEDKKRINLIRLMMSCEEDKIKILKSMKKSEIRKILKEQNAYYKGMDKEEMYDMMMTIF